MCNKRFLQGQRKKLFLKSETTDFVQDKTDKHLLCNSLCFMFLVVFLLNVLNLVFHKPKTCTQLKLSSFEMEYRNIIQEKTSLHTISIDKLKHQTCTYTYIRNALLFSKFEVNGKVYGHVWFKGGNDLALQIEGTD